MSRDALLDGLGASDLRDVERAVAAIQQQPAAESDPDVLFAAGRACEDKLLDPERAVALYDRVIAEHPTARVATAALRRAAPLRAQIGPHGETAALAAELARLTARADAQPAAAVIREAERLTAVAWPGAPAAALWLADWLRRAGRIDDAQAHYAMIVARWPTLPEAQAALRGGAGCALEAHDWSLAETLANRLPAADPTDRAVRDDFLTAVARGRRRDRWYVLAWLAIAAAAGALAGSLVEAILRSPPGTRWSALRPPIEILLLGPVAAVLIGIAFTAHRLFAPAVASIAGGGLVLAWLSGAALERLRARGRSRRLRGIAHVLICLVGVAALGYVALDRDNLLDMLIETGRFGPEP
jgi:tetratricopeptide (TPR) repeat protein